MNEETAVTRSFPDPKYWVIYRGEPGFKDVEPGHYWTGACTVDCIYVPLTVDPVDPDGEENK